jgi:hypothetical protein
MAVKISPAKYPNTGAGIQVGAANFLFKAP